MLLFRRLVTGLACFAFVVIANHASASIVISKVALELSADDIANVDGATSTSSSDNSGSQVSHHKPPPLPLEEIRRLGLAAYVGSLGLGTSSSMAGGSSNTLSSGSNMMAIAFASEVSFSDSLLCWVSESRWLDIPMPPGVTLLRPPQSV